MYSRWKCVKVLKCVCVCCLGVVHAPVQSTCRTLPPFHMHRSSQRMLRFQWGSGFGVKLNNFKSAVCSSPFKLRHHAIMLNLNFPTQKFIVLPSLPTTLTNSLLSQWMTPSLDEWWEDQCTRKGGSMRCVNWTGAWTTPKQHTHTL